jgi:LmbE family N-acetylglucosaminyl deacetylase
MTRRLSLVFAHPDDDSFGVGGTIAKHRDDLELQVILATSGEAGMIADPSLATRENLGAVREEESRASYRALGVQPEQHFLRYPDGGLPGVDREEVATRIAELLRRFRPDVVVTFGPEGVTKHDDHVAIHHIGTDSFHLARVGEDGSGFHRLFYVGIPASEIERFRELQRMAGQEPFNPEDPFQPRGVPDETIAVWADCTDVWRTKHEALLAHRTQSTEVEEIPEQARPLVFGNEYFVQAWPEREASTERARDLFEGLPGV